MSSPEPVSPNLDALPPTPPEPLSPAKRILVTLLILSGIALSVERARLWSGGLLNAQSFGYAVGTLLSPLVISYLIAGRKNHRKPVLFAVLFAGFVFLLGGMGLFHRSKDFKAEVVDVIREASGTKPVDRNSPNSPVFQLAREVMTELLNSSTAYRQSAHDASARLQNLYTPASFSSPDEMSRVRDSVQNAAAIDHEFFVQIEEWPARVQQRAAQSSLTESEKEDFLEGFNKAFLNSKILTLRKETDQIEDQWCKDTLALYDFALSQAGQIHVKNAHILIDDDNVRTRFNDSLHRAREQQKKFGDANAQLAKLQQEELQKLGLTKKDVGIAEPANSR
jgi:hypothetical protein